MCGRRVVHLIGVGFACFLSLGEGGSGRIWVRMASFPPPFRAEGFLALADKCSDHALHRRRSEDECVMDAVNGEGCYTGERFGTIWQDGYEGLAGCGAG